MIRQTALGIAAAGSLLLAGLSPPSNAATSSGPAKILSLSQDLGRIDQSTPIQITVWLNLHDRAGLERAVAAQRAGSAPPLSEAEIQSRYVPSAAEVNSVSGFLSSHGLKVTGVGPDNLFVKATGSTATIESALHIELHQYRFHDRTFRASEAMPTFPSNIAPLVSSVGGLNTFGMRSMIARRVQLNTLARTSDVENEPALQVPLTAQSNGLFFSAQCFYPPTTVSFAGTTSTATGSAVNGTATATYHGNRYGADINNQNIGSLPPCGYQPSDLQTAYNMTSLYKAGLDGSGVTIAIVDAFGSETIAQDAATFSAAMGLPAPQLTVVGTPTETGYSGDANSGWADETTLDVEWVHAIAPKAKILLVVAPSNYDSDLFAAIETAAKTPGVVAISDSWGEWEIAEGVAALQSDDAVILLANARGVAVNFSSGDYGNNAVQLGFADANYPASSPYATAVGGVSVGLNPAKHVNFQSAWGNNITELADTTALGSPPIDPPLNEGFVYGGGGGASDHYAQPYFQRSLPGNRRLVPDISWVADPYTGVEIVETECVASTTAGAPPSCGEYISVIGGTSLAAPMFTALWGIASQKAGHRLGQAAPYLYSLPDSAITDVLDASSPTNVSGEVTDSQGSLQYGPWDLAAPVQGVQSFYSALYNSPHSTRWFVLTFGTDSALQAAPGWDPATGLGTPNGWNFVQSFGNPGGR